MPSYGHHGRFYVDSEPDYSGAYVTILTHRFFVGFFVCAVVFCSFYPSSPLHLPPQKKDKQKPTKNLNQPKKKIKPTTWKTVENWALITQD